MSFVEKTLYQLFSEYAQQGNLYKSSQLRLNRLTDLLKDAKIFNEAFSQSKLPVLVHSVNARSPTLPFRKFCALVAKLAEAKYSVEFQVSPPAAYDRLFTDHLVPRAQEVTANYAVLRRTDLNLSTDITTIAQSLFRAFQAIYEASFPAELSRDTPVEFLFQDGLKQLETLLTQLDIYPNLVNKATVHGLWRDIVVMQPERGSRIISSALLPSARHERGQVFTLSKFILFVYLCALYGFQETRVVKVNPTDKFVGLLERIHLAVARQFKNFSLLPDPELLQRLRTQEDPVSDESTDVGPPTEVQLDRLQAKFQEYCSLKGPLQASLKPAGFLQFLQNAGLLTVLSAVDARLVYASATSKSGQMDFPSFLKAVELLATKLHQSFERLVLDHFLVAKSLSQPGDAVKAYHTSKHLESLEEGVFGALTKPMQYFFNYYSNRSQHLGFREFMRFCKDFGIFPDMASNKKLNQAFAEASGRNHWLTLDAFVRVLVTIASEIESGHSPTAKVCLFVERLCQSPGPARVYKQQGHSRNAGKDLHEAVAYLRPLCQRKPAPQPTFEDFSLQFSY